jgi:predicted nucleic acid-binding protein
MLSIDTNILFHAFNADSKDHHRAYRFIDEQSENSDVAVSEFILAELYGLLRNPAVLRKPLSASETVAVIDSYRKHPRWLLLGFPSESRSMHDAMWKKARASGFAFRRLYDVRSALTLLAQGVTEFATANTKDFEHLGFRKIYNPLR